MDTPQSPFENIPEGETAERVVDTLTGQEVLDEGGNLLGTIADVVTDEKRGIIKEIVLNDGTAYPAQTLTYTDGTLYVDRGAPAADEAVLPSEGERLPNEEVAADMQGYVRDDRAAMDAGHSTQELEEMGTEEIPDVDFEPTRPLEERQHASSMERRSYEEVEEEMRDKFESTPGEAEEKNLPHPEERRGYDRLDEE